MYFAEKFKCFTLKCAFDLSSILLGHLLFIKHCSLLYFYVCLTLFLCKTQYYLFNGSNLLRSELPIFSTPCSYVSSCFNFGLFSDDAMFWKYFIKLLSFLYCMYRRFWKSYDLGSCLFSISLIIRSSVCFRVHYSF